MNVNELEDEENRHYFGFLNVRPSVSQHGRKNSLSGGNR